MMKKRLKITLAVSLALNLILIGVVSGYVMRVMLPGAMVEYMHRDLLSRIPKEKAERFYHAMKAILDKLQIESGEQQARRKELLSIITAPTFDEKAFRTAFENIGTIHRQFEQDVTETMAKFILTLTPEERIQFAEHLKKLPMIAPPPMDMPHP